MESFFEEVYLSGNFNPQNVNTQSVKHAEDNEGFDIIEEPLDGTEINVEPDFYMDETTEMTMDEDDLDCTIIDEVKPLKAMRNFPNSRIVRPWAQIYAQQDLTPPAEVTLDEEDEDPFEVTIIDDSMYKEDILEVTVINDSTNSTPKKIKCPVKGCRSKFDSRNEIVKHVINKYLFLIKDKTGAAIVENSEKIFECEKCEKKYHTGFGLIKHYGIFHKILEDEVDEKTWTLLSGKEKQSSYRKVLIGPKTNLCIIKGCSSKFSTQTQLKIHLVKHCLDEIESKFGMGKDDLKCTVCEKDFQNSVYAQYHMAWKHKAMLSKLTKDEFKTFQKVVLTKKTFKMPSVSERIWGCEFKPCPAIQKFTKKADLKDHVSSIHLKADIVEAANLSSAREKRCKECMFEFSMAAKLLTHLVFQHKILGDQNTAPVEIRSIMDSRSIMKKVNNQGSQKAKNNLSRTISTESGMGTSFDRSMEAESLAPVSIRNIIESQNMKKKAKNQSSKKAKNDLSRKISTESGMGTSFDASMEAQDLAPATMRNSPSIQKNVKNQGPKKAKNDLSRKISTSSGESGIGNSFDTSLEAKDLSPRATVVAPVKIRNMKKKEAKNLSFRNANKDTPIKAQELPPVEVKKPKNHNSKKTKNNLGKTISSANGIETSFDTSTEAKNLPPVSFANIIDAQRPKEKASSKKAKNDLSRKISNKNEFNNSLEATIEAEANAFHQRNMQLLRTF